MNKMNDQKHYCHILIIGSGIAGLAAAITAADLGLDVIVITKENDLKESNTNYAQGGIVCLGEDDSPDLLINDIISAGDGISNPEAVKILAHEGPILVEHFLVKKIGVPFRRSEGGYFEYAQEGSHSRRRILHCMDTTGMAIETSLEKKVKEICEHYNLTIPLHSLVQDVSVGIQQRVEIIKAIYRGAEILILDEPTNDIDVNTMRALEEGLLNFAGCALIISHDRWFLDRVATHILSFEGNSQVYFFEGTYSEYEENKRKRIGDDNPHRLRYKKLQ